MLNRRQVISTNFSSLELVSITTLLRNNQRALGAAAVGKEHYAARA